LFAKLNFVNEHRPSVCKQTDGLRAGWRLQPALQQDEVSLARAQKLDGLPVGLKPE
jgi:hypothetical protein